MNFEEELYNLDVPEEHIPELLKFGKDNPEFLTKVIKAEGNAKKYSVAQTKMEPSDLINNQIAFLGSSVTYGAGALGESFVDYLSKKDNICAFKDAVSGTTLVDNDSNSYIGRIGRLPVLEKLTAFVLQLSTNDAIKGKEDLGEIAADDNFDTQTVTGAIEYILNYVKKNWNCPVLIFSNPKFDSEFYGQMVERVKELQNKWNFNFLNLWDNDSFNYSEKDRELYMLDPIHPTRAGYKLSWLPVIEEELLKIKK